MASQVNVKFVVILVVGVIVLLGGMLFAYATFVRKSGEDYIRMGDQMMAEGNYRQAAINYGHAYGHDRSRADWLQKWIDALETWVPETRTEYSGAYRQKYVPVLLSMSQVKDGGMNIEAHDRYLSLVRDQSLHSPYSRAAMDSLIAQAENALRYFEYVPEDQTDWHRLRRYRGLAISRIISEGGTLEDGMRDQAVEDLQAALAVVPDDNESLRGLLGILMRETFDHRVVGDYVQAQRDLDEAKGLVNRFVADNPEHPDALLSKLTVDIEQMRHDLQQEAARSGRPIAEANTAQFRPTLDRVEQMVLANPGAPGTERLISRFLMLESSLDPEAGLRRTERMSKALVETDPTSASALMLLARVLERPDRTEERVEVLRRVQELPPLPLSLEGMMQYSFQEYAVGEEAITYLTELSTIEDTEANEATRGAVLAEAEDARRRFAQVVPEGNPRLLMIDGMIALAKEDLPRALSLFQEFNRLTSDLDFDGLWREAQVAAQLGQNGVARNRLNTMLNMRPRNLPATLLLAAVEMRLNNSEGAKELFEDALEQDPTNESALRGLRQAREILGEQAAEDPVIEALLRSRSLLQGDAERVGDPQASIEYLASRIEELDHDPRLARELAGLYLGQEEMGAARAVINKSIERHPDDKALGIVREALLADNVVDARIRLYELSDAPETQRLLGVYSVYTASNQTEKARQVLERLVEIAPEDPSVLEVRLVNALANGDDAEAERVTQIAQRTNADRMDGLTFLARLESSRGRGAEAVEIIRRAIGEGQADVGVYRLLARQLILLGRYDEATTAYEQALEIRPDDLTSIMEYLRSLITIRQNQTALERAREMERYGRTSTQFMDLWLRLEAVAGGPAGIQFAIDRRRQLLQLDPANRTNRTELARHYITAKQFDLARPLLDELRAEKDALELVELDARWYADQITVRVNDTARDGVEMARGVYVSYLLSIENDPEEAAQVYVSLAQFMLSRGRRQVAIDALIEAQEIQDPETRIADRMLADVYAAVNQWEEALELYRNLAESGLDDDNRSYQKRVVEALLRLSRFDEARAELGKIESMAPTDTTVRLQQAERARSTGDFNRAIELLDLAVSENPTEPLVYVQRARAKLDRDDLRDDVQADLDQALKLNPNDWRTLRVRAAFLYDQGRDNEAINDLRAALRLNPGLDEVLLGLVLEFIEQGREGEAQSIAEEIIELRQGDVQLSTQVAALFVEHELWGRAASFYADAWERSGSEAVAGALIDAYLRTDPPRIRDARDVLSKLIENGADAREDPKILGIRAIIDFVAGLESDAQQRAIVAFEKAALRVDADPGLLNTWSINVARMYDGKPDSELIAFMRQIARSQAPGSPGRDWLEFFIAQRQLESDQTRQQGLEGMLALRDNSKTTHIPRLAARVAGSVPYGDGDYERAEVLWTEGLDRYPDDWEMLNNLAYLIGERLNQPERAMPLALQARDATRGQNAQVLDTLAAIQARMGDYQEAKQNLLVALRQVRAIDARLPLTVRLAKVHLALNEIPQASVLLEQIRADASVGRTRLERYQSDIDEIQSGIDSTRAP
ncbi:MAG: tetratricopeptide repeat protein [Phycisphaerales bacterium JB059]